MTLRSALYLRYSSALQDDASIETQRAECAKRALAMGASVVGEYVDEAQSGRVDDRPAFQRMIADARSAGHPFDVIIVRKFSRFARDVLASRTYKSLLRKHGVRVVSVHEESADDPSGRLMEGIIEVIDEFYSQSLAVETRSGMVTNTKRGFRSGGTAPFGFRNVRAVDPATGKTRTRLELDDHEAAGVRLLFRRYREGAGLTAIASELMLAGFRPRTAMEWAKSQLHWMLRQEVYTGTLVWRAGSDPTEWARCPGGCPRIVDDKTWRAVSARIDQQTSSGVGARSQTANRPLAGFVWCGVCGARYTLKTVRGSTAYYSCAGRMKRVCHNGVCVNETETVDRLRDVIEKELLRPESLIEAGRTMSRDVAATRFESRASLDALRKRIMTLETQQRRLVDLIAAGDVPDGPVRRRLTDLESERANLLLQADALTTDIDAADAAAMTDSDIERFAADVAALIRTATGQALRAVFRLIGLRIVIRPDGVTVEVSPDPTGGSAPAGGGGVSFEPGSRHCTKPHRMRVTTATYGVFFVRG
jgi:site-specific DNA recombinase